MRTWTKWALVVVIGAGFTWGSMRVASRMPPPALRIAEDELDFGNAWITDALPHEVTIRNETDERVSVRLDDVEWDFVPTRGVAVRYAGRGAARRRYRCRLCLGGLCLRLP